VITAVVAVVTPDGPKSVGEAPALKCVNGTICSPEHTTFQNVKLCQIYSHALLKMKGEVVPLQA
jgi:hypothetical protein